MSLEIKENIELNAHTTLRIGGFARYMAEVRDKEELLKVALFAEENNLPVLPLGGGSNLLISDDGYTGVVVKNLIKGRKLISENEEEVLISFGSGECLDEVVEYTVNRGWWGIENLTSVPGTIGAAPVQNVGAYGVEIENVIFEIEAINLETKKQKIFKKEECEFGYRDSFFKSFLGKKYFIIQVTILLSKKPKPKIDYADLKKIFESATPTQMEIRSAVKEVRANKFPDWKSLGTAGSFFKNPIIKREHLAVIQSDYPEVPYYEVDGVSVKIPLGYVLDKVCDLKGYRVGKVGLSEVQALVLINYGGATATEVKNFVNQIKEKVFEKTKIEIHPEVIFI